MIEIVLKEKLDNITTYKSGDEIPFSEQQFSFSPRKLLRNGYFNEEFEYLKILENHSAYLVDLLKLYKFAKTVIDDQEVKRRNILEEEKLFGYSRKDEVTGKMLNFKEALAKNDIESGKKIFSELERISREYDFDDGMVSFVKDVNKKKVDLPVENPYKDIEGFKYIEYRADDNDIYYWFYSDIPKLIDELIMQYLTEINHFVNTGRTYFAVEEKFFLYFVGDREGFLKTTTEIKLYKDKFNESLFNEFLTEIEELHISLCECIKEIQKQSSTNYKMDDKSKNRSFLSDLDELCESKRGDAKKLKEICIKNGCLADFNKLYGFIENEKLLNAEEIAFCYFEILKNHKVQTNENLPYNHIFFDIICKTNKIRFGKDRFNNCVSDIRTGKIKKSDLLEKNPKIYDFFKSDSA